MALFNFFRQKPTETRSAEPTVEPQVSLTDVTGLGLLFGKYRSDNLARNLSAVFRAVSLISNSVASLPINILKYDDEQCTMTPAKSHPLWPILLKRPHPYFDAFTLIKAMVSDMLLWGNGFALIQRKGLNIVGLEYIPASKVSIKKDYARDGSLESVKYNIVGRGRLYEAHEILHVKNELDESALWGVSTLSYAARTLKLANANEDSAINLFESGGKLSGLLKIQGNITTKQREELRQAWRESLGSGKESVAILSGIQDYQSVSMSAVDQQLLETRKFEVEEIGRFFNLPSELLFSGKNSYNSIEAMKLLLLTDTLQPIVTKIENEFESKLLTADESTKYEIRLQVEDFTKSNRKEMAEYLRVLWNFGILSISEVRAKLGLPKLDDEELPASRRHYIPAQVLPLKNSENIGALPTEASVQIDNNLLQNDEPKKKEEGTEEGATD